MLIGLDADSQFENAQIQLEAGDTLLYYTDGLTDAVNATGDRFDENNLIQVFAQACEREVMPQAILNFLFESVMAFSGSENENSDDMTLVVMRVKSTE
jgi:sigma-B regulation protein RsbU (phosphoserine phosphatase)